MPCLCGSGPRDVFTPAAVPLAGTPGRAAEQQKTEVAAFDALLAAVEVLTEDLSAAATALAAAPLRFAEHLERGAQAEGLPVFWSQLSGRLAGQLNLCSEGLRGGERHLHALRYLLEQSRSQSLAVSEAARAREEAWAPKVAADRNAAELSKRFGPTLLPRERKARLQARHAADLEFSKRHAEATRAAEAMIERRWAITGAMLWEVCQFFTALLQDAPKLLRGFGDVSNRLVPPRSTESQLVPQDSIIASMAVAGCQGVREWIEQASSKTGPDVSQGVASLRLPARRAPVAAPLTPRAPPPLQQAGGGAPSLASSAPGRLEGVAAPVPSISPRRPSVASRDGERTAPVPATPAAAAAPEALAAATKERSASIESHLERMGETLQAWLGGVSSSLSAPAPAPTASTAST